MSNESNNPLGTQVGGDHYKHFKIQPIEFIIANRIEGAEAYVIKYVCRWRNKNGVEDLRKARHTLDIMIQEEKAATAEPEPLAPAETAEDAEWPKVGDGFWTFPNNSSAFIPCFIIWDGGRDQRAWLRNGEVFHTEAEAEAEWHKRYGKKPEPVASEPVTLNADEMAMVANGQMIPAIKALRVRRFGATGVSMPLSDAKAIVDAYRASIKASEPPPVKRDHEPTWCVYHGGLVRHRRDMTDMQWEHHHGFRRTFATRAAAREFARKEREAAK